MIPDIGGYLNGAVIDHETPIFRGAGNLPVLAPDGSYFFLGISIEGGTVLTFGDRTNDNLVFLGANYKSTAQNSPSQFIFLETAVFDSWLLQENGNPPTSEKWQLISFGDWTAPKDAATSIENNSFETHIQFQVGVSIFIDFCTKLKQKNDPLCGRLLLIAQVIAEQDDASNADEDTSSEGGGGLEEGERDEEDDDVVVVTVTGTALPQVKKRKPKKKKDPNAKGERRSDRNFVKKLNQEIDAITPAEPKFQMPRRGRKSVSGAKKKVEPAVKPKQKDNPKIKTKDDPAPPKINKRSRSADDAKDADYETVRTPMQPPVAFTTPIPAAEAYTFETAMSQQDRILTFQERFANFLFNKAERYKNGG